MNSAEGNTLGHMCLNHAYKRRRQLIGCAQVRLVVSSIMISAFLSDFLSVAVRSGWKQAFQVLERHMQWMVSERLFGTTLPIHTKIRGSRLSLLMLRLWLLWNALCFPFERSFSMKEARKCCTSPYTIAGDLAPWSVHALGTLRVL